MSNIKNILSSLGEEQRSQLMYAFNNDMTQIIIYAGKNFIGVNCSQLSNVIIIEEKGSWVIGEIK